MPSTFTALTRTDLVPRLCLTVLAVLGIVALGRIVQKTGAVYGGEDVYAYWYQGLTLRQGGNPYRMALEGKGPSLPVQHLAGMVTSKWPVYHERMNRTPYISAALALVLFQLSWFSWPVAKWLFMVLNVAVVLFIPRLVLRSFPNYPSLSRTERWLVHLAFYAFVPTRVGVWLGQISIPVFALMLLALLLKERNWLLAGICLGLALSKYAVALPLALLLLLRWRRGYLRIFATALLVQLAAVLLISLRCGDSLPQLLRDHLDVVLNFARWSRAFATQLSVLVPEGPRLVAAGVLVAFFVAGLLSWWLRRWRQLPADFVPLAEYHLWVILVLSALLVVYHSSYDVLMTVVFLPLGLYIVRYPDRWRLTVWQARFVTAVIVLQVGILILPGNIVNVVLSDAATDQWLGIVEQAVTWMVLAVLGTAVWLLMRLFRPAQPQEA